MNECRENCLVLRGRREGGKKGGGREEEGRREGGKKGGGREGRREEGGRGDNMLATYVMTTVFSSLADFRIHFLKNCCHYYITITSQIHCLLFPVFPFVVCK